MKFVADILFQPRAKDKCMLEKRTLLQRKEPPCVSHLQVGRFSTNAAGWIALIPYGNCSGSKWMHCELVDSAALVFVPMDSFFFFFFFFFNWLYNPWWVLASLTNCPPSVSIGYFCPPSPDSHCCQVRNHAVHPPHPRTFQWTANTAKCFNY
jgi:hypothetical protein